MPRTIRSHEVHIPTWLGASELQPHVDGLVRYIKDSGYSHSTLHVYRNSVAHFARWMTGCNVALGRLDESHVRRFLSEHLPTCRCGPLRQRWPHSVRAALKVLLRFLRSKNLIELERSTDPAAVASELQAFAEYQEHVCGLTQSTREVSRRRVRALLLKCFDNGAVCMDRLTDKDLKRFLTRYTANCTARSRAVIYHSIRGYLHFKALTEPNAEVLCERLPRFAAWRLASLPKSLSPAESRAVLAACWGDDAVSRRDYAILRCLHDLGLRTVEVSRLQLDDFDWTAGTVRVRGKGHRVDVMPIPALTGSAIVSYLRHGRPRIAS
jgi:integrase/recombinase XerD